MSVRSRTRDCIELKDAIERLGGKLTPKQEEKFAAAMEVERIMRGGAVGDDDEDNAGMPVRVEKKPGRNEPCWCGSGKKYKKCHLGADEKRAS